MRSPGLLRWAIPVAFLSAAACASRGTAATEPAAPAPAAAEPAASVQPPAEAVRASERVTLTGTELGTMWTFENPPLDYWQSRYGFRPTAEWLEHVRLSSVRYGDSCSASFVSSAGLVMTNHHCARECIEANSSARDYVVEGFYAPTRKEELLCPGLFLDQLVEIQDVSQRVQGAAPSAASATQIAEAQQAEQAEIQQACEAASGLSCQVVSLFHGGQFKLYKYQRYEPVKLVFAPELQAGFFGGDPDNFTYPRYDLDVSFVRAYDADGTPARTPHYFQWDASGADENELVFITGNPGGTSRLVTVSQLMYELRLRHPYTVRLLELEVGILKRIAQQGPEAEKQVRDRLFSVENALKAYRGQLGGLRDTLLLGRKIRWEREFRQKVEADAARRAQYADAWDRMAEIQAEKLQVAAHRNLNDFNFRLAAPHLTLAGMLVRYIRETAKPEAERLERYRGENLQQIEQTLNGPTRVNPDFSALLLEAQLQLAREFLPPDAPMVREAFHAGESAADAAHRLVTETRVDEVDSRRALMRAGPAALDTASDLLVRLARVMDGAFREAERRLNDLEARQSVQDERLAQALFAVFGTQLPPDATFTLRISDGVVRRYPYNGTFAPPVTTFHGMYARSAEFNNEMPWTLPRSFAERRSAVALTTPLNFVTTNDITGGNSGSPLIDREARVIGVAFDSNIEGLPNEFLFSTEAARAVGVHAAGITEALRNVYRADALLKELVGEEPKKK
ncbi:MAG: S46 family peptidase [Gemmatimonadetes bacterium]|nr:S46 family peptidase [Gemmatimonadota bacterium]